MAYSPAVRTSMTAAMLVMSIDSLLEQAVSELTAKIAITEATRNLMNFDIGFFLLDTP